MAEFPVLVSLSSLAPVVLEAGLWCWRKRKDNIQKKNESALVLSLGRTTLCEQLRGSDVLVLDIDNMVRAAMCPDELATFEGMARDDPTKTIKYLTVARQEYEKVKTQFSKKKRILSVCPSLECAEYLGIPLTSIYMCAPSGPLFERLTEGLGVEAKKKRSDERLAFLLSAHNLLTFNTYEELYGIVRGAWGVKNRL